MKKENLFERLNRINVNEYTETKKQGNFSLTYLNWASAFRLLEENVDSVSYRVIETEEGLPFWDTPLGLFVKTEMTVDGITKTMTLPVLDHANAPMYSTPGKIIRFGKEQNRSVASAFDVNTAIMRCYVKNMAMYGLGMYIYEGENSPVVGKAEQPAKTGKDGGLLF